MLGAVQTLKKSLPHWASNSHVDNTFEHATHSCWASRLSSLVKPAYHKQSDQKGEMNMIIYVYKT